MKCCNDSAVKVDVGHQALASGHFGSRRWWAHFGGMISGAGGKNSVEPHTQGDRVLVVLLSITFVVGAAIGAILVGAWI